MQAICQGEQTLPVVPKDLEVIHDFQQPRLTQLVKALVNDIAVITALNCRGPNVVRKAISLGKPENSLQLPDYINKKRTTYRVEKQRYTWPRS